MHTQEASRRHEDGFRRPPNPQKTPPRGQNGSETYRKSMFVVFSHFRFRLPFQASSWPQDGTREPQEEPTRCPGGGPRRVSQMRNGRCTSMVWVRGRPRGHWGASVGPESAPRRAQEGAPRCATRPLHIYGLGRGSFQRAQMGAHMAQKMPQDVPWRGPQGAPGCATAVAHLWVGWGGYQNGRGGL